MSDPTDASWPSLGPNPVSGRRWYYAARGFYGPKARFPRTPGHCAIVVGLADRTTLWMELQAFKARMEHGDIGRVEFIAYNRPGDTFVYTAPNQIPARDMDLP